MAHKKIPIEDVIKMLDAKLGYKTETAKALGISYQALNQRIHKNKSLADAYEALRQSKLDFAESKLFSAIKAGNVVANIFFLKCMGADRGWVDKQVISGEGAGGKIQVEVTVVYETEQYGKPKTKT
jgi:hypothetical protein